ncbi:MAG: 2-oxoacid:acceptor oxidoreductase family protein [Candidatus Omnitrophica bacterium]|nr:2-oxoacid:acceptor oxidoreductase family protein [Candidatus Omnitrophota bacterium]
MIEKIIIAGSGGQGIMLAGKILAETAMQEGRAVTWLPAYGPEVRGGTSHCMLIISDQEISSPCVDKADTLIIMNGPSVVKFKGRVKNNGLLIINSSLSSANIKSQAKIVKQPFTDMAIALGNIKVANMIALGCYLANKKIVAAKNLSRVIQKIAPEDKKALIKINQEALEKGLKV